MRLHITVDDATVAALDARVGARRRSAFITAALRRALEDEQRWEALADSVGALSDEPREWDDDPAQWVRTQRRDDRRAG